MSTDPKKWITKSRQDIVRHPRMHLVEDEVVLPDGNIIKYLRQAPVELHSVGIIAMDSKGRILLQREYSYPPNQIMWQLPGGGMKEGEDLEVAASRELSEESGYIAGKCELLGFFYTNNRRSDEKQFIVMCSQLTKKKLSEDPEEFIISSWIEPSEIQKMISEGKIENVNLLAALNLFISKRC